MIADSEVRQLVTQYMNGLNGQVLSRQHCRSHDWATRIIRREMSSVACLIQWGYVGTTVALAHIICKQNLAKMRGRGDDILVVCRQAWDVKDQRILDLPAIERHQWRLKRRVRS